MSLDRLRVEVALPLSCVALLLLAPGTAGAQGVTGDAARFEADMSEPSGRLSNGGVSLLGVGVGLGQIDKDFFTTFYLRLNFAREGWGLGFGLPLRLRLVDEDPKSMDDYAGIIRHEDWDAATDFLRILRYAYVGKPDRSGNYYARIGEIHNLTIGHGSMVYRYYNGFDIDRFRFGANAFVNAGPIGVELVASDLVRSGSDLGLAGGRFTFKPLSAAMGKGPWADRLVLGASFMADANAPVTVAREPDMMGPPDPITGALGPIIPGGIRVDSDQVPLASARRVVGIMGVDAEYTIWDDDYARITPYVDANKMAHGGDGRGLHLGVLWAFHFPLVIGPLELRLRTEYRRTDGDYLAPYFGMLHESERFSFPSGGADTKLQVLRNARGTPGHDGVFFDFVAGLPGWVYLGAEYIDRGPSSRATRLSLQLPALEVVQLRAFYYRTDVDGIGDIFGFDKRTAMVADAKIHVYWIFSGLLHWWRVWRESDNQPIDDWSVGLGVDISL